MWLFVKLGSWCYRTNVCVTGVMSLLPRDYEADVMVQVVQNHSLCDRCYVSPSLVVMDCYLSLSSGEFITTSSHICSSWYLPIFLLRDWLFTLMRMASLMDLAKFWSSLAKMLKLFMDISWPVLLWWSWLGDGAFMYALYLSANVLPNSPMYSSSQSTLACLYLYITPLFCQMISLSLGLNRRSLMVLPPLKWICVPCLLWMVLQLLLKPLIYGTTIWGLLVLLVVLFLMLLDILWTCWIWCWSSAVAKLFDVTQVSVCLLSTDILDIC